MWTLCRNLVELEHLVPFVRRNNYNVIVVTSHLWRRDIVVVCNHLYSSTKIFMCYYVSHLVTEVNAGREVFERWSSKVVDCDVLAPIFIFFFKFLSDQGLCGAIGTLCLGFRMILPISFKDRVESSSPALFCHLCSMIPRLPESGIEPRISCLLNRNDTNAPA